MDGVRAVCYYDRTAGDKATNVIIGIRSGQPMESGAGVTGKEAGLSGDEQIKIALAALVAYGGQADMQVAYEAVEAQLGGRELSEQGRASLRRLINFNAVQAGYIYPYDRGNPGWRITPEGREFLQNAQQLEPPEEVFNVDTQVSELRESNTVRGAAFERYVGLLLKAMYPQYTWYNQGRHKQNERGLDFIGRRFGEHGNEASSIGVQVKFHTANTAPSAIEWLKFLAGCFARRVDQSVFITSGRLTAEQHREAGEAGVIVVEGREEIARIAQRLGVERFNLFDEQADE